MGSCSRLNVAQRDRCAGGAPTLAAGLTVDLSGAVGPTRNHGGVPLKLVTGPANAEKAKVVLDGYRAALRRGEEPILVVPTFADVERYRAELAAAGVVFGAQVVRFAWLIEECARRGGVRGRPLGTLARERIAAPSSARRRCTRSPRRRARAASRASCCASSTSSRRCASRPSA